MSQISSGITGVKSFVMSIAGFLSKHLDQGGTHDSFLANHRSLIEKTKPLRADPITLLDSSLLYNNSTSDILEAALSIWTGYYVQAIHLTVNVGDVSIIKKLDSLSTVTGGGRDLFDQGFLSLENHGYGVYAGSNRLPNWNHVEKEDKFIKDFYMNLESAPIAILDASGKEKDTKENKQSSIGFSNAVKDIKEVANLAIGKLVAIEIVTENGKVPTHLNVRLSVNAVKPNVLIGMLAGDLTDIIDPKSVVERWYGWKAGRLATLKDMVLCTDLLDRYRSGRLKNKEGGVDQASEANVKNILRNITNNSYSAVAATSILVIDSANLEEVERLTARKFSNYANRERMFKDTFLMLLLSVDLERERVTIYHRTIPETTEVSFKDMQRVASGKGGGADINSILQAYMQGSAPRFQ